MNSKLLNTAYSQFGLREIRGKNDNPEIIKYFDALGFDGSKLKDETAWCSAFVNWVAKISGYEFTGKLNARSWLNIGTQVSKPVPGDLVILWREHPNSWKGHVGFYITERWGWIYILGGNQNNRVKISAYRKNRLLQYRRLSTTTK